MGRIWAERGLNMGGLEGHGERPTTLTVHDVMCVWGGEEMGGCLSSRRH